MIQWLNFLEIVDIREFLFEVGDIGGGGEGFSGGEGDELGGGIFFAVVVDVGLEPLIEAGEVGVLDVLAESGEVFGGGFEELCGEDVAEGVGGEVTDAAAGPVDVLEDAFAVGGGRDAEGGLHFGVPGGGGVLDGELFFEEGLFHFVAEDDVEVVGDFVGFDADEGGGDLVDGAIEGVERGGGELFGEGFLEEGIVAGPEFAGASDQVFPEAGLGFVDAEGDAAGEGCGFEFWIDVEFVEGVAHFVEAAEESAREPLFFVAGGDADVVLGEVGAEGVDGDVEAAAVEGEAAVFEDSSGEGLLAGGVVIAGEDFVGDAVGLFFDGGDEGDGEIFEGLEDGVEEGGGHAFFVIVEEDVVDGFVRLAPPQGGGVLAFEVVDFFEPGGEEGKVVFGAGGLPDFLGEGAGFGEFND